MNLLAVLAATALVVAGSVSPAQALGAARTTSQADWLDWVSDHARSFARFTADTALAVDVHIESAVSVTVRGVVNADGSLAVSLTQGGSRFHLRCVNDSECWVRQPTGGSDVLWHRIPAHETADLRRPLPDVDGLLAPGTACSVDGSTASLAYEEDGASVMVSVAFSDGAFHLAERLVVPDQDVDLTVTKSLTRTGDVRIKRPKSALIGGPMVKDVVPQLP